MAAYIQSLLVYVCMLQCSAVDCTNNALPDDGVTAPKHVVAVLM